MLYLNFEDERLLGFDVSDFNRILTAHAELSGRMDRPVLFLDEIQIVEGWERFARRMADAEAEIFIAGSSAKMSGANVVTQPGAGFMAVNVFPLSFSEMLHAEDVPFDAAAMSSTTGRVLIRRTFARFLQKGGFPECARLEKNRDELNSLYRDIYLTDIAARNGISNVLALRVMLKKWPKALDSRSHFRASHALSKPPATAFRRRQ